MAEAELKPEKAFVYCRKEEPFKGTNELDEILDTLNENLISRVPPYMPKGGEVYIYAWKDDSEESKSRWRCDHHRWRQYGGRGYPFSRSKYFKEFSSIILDDGSWTNLFQRITFTPLNPNFSLIIIHYIGDHTLSTTPYKYVPRFREPRRASFEDIKEEGKSPKKIKKAPVKKSFKCRRPIKPKQPDAATDHYQKALQHLTESTKSKVLGWMNLKGLALHLDGFIHRLTIIPVTMCVCGSPSMSEEFTKVLELQSMQPQIMWFGNTRKIDDYFISSLMFRHLLLEGSPLMPLLFAIHDERFEKCATEILVHAVTHIPQLASAEIPIVVERNVSKSVAKCLPMARTIHTWGHIREEVRRWAKSTGYRDLTQFTSRLPEFLECRSLEQFERRFEMHKASWQENWVEFFSTELSHDIKQSSGRWVLEGLGVYSSFTGVISQVCESYECVLDGFKEFGCVTVDMLVLAFHYLHNYLIRQARIAQCGLPCAFGVKREFHEALREETEITIPETSVLPENIVETIQQQFSSVTSDGASQFAPREYVATKIEPDVASETIITEPTEDILLIQAIDETSGSVMETIEIPNDIQQLTQQTGLQRSLINGKLFRTYQPSQENNF